ncbi:MAG: hypothetical protein ACOC9W_02445 [Persicimonas sp.]
MATDTTALTSRWATRLGVRGEVLQGVEEIEQEIRVVCRTQKRSVPQDPELGVDWLKVLDLPVSEATPIIVLEVTEALARWVPRAKVQSVEVIGGTEKSRLRIGWRPAGEAPRLRTTELDLS